VEGSKNGWGRRFSEKCNFASGKRKEHAKKKRVETLRREKEKIVRSKAPVKGRKVHIRPKRAQPGKKEGTAQTGWKGDLEKPKREGLTNRQEKQRTRKLGGITG